MKNLDDAVRHLSEGRTEDAIAACRAVLQTEEEQPDALHLLAFITYQSGDAREAIALIRRAVAARPDFPDAHNNLGNMLREQGDLEGAAEEYRTAIELKPDFGDALSNLGAVLHAEGRTVEAIDTYRRAIGVSPGLAAAHYNLGNAQRSLGRYSDARKAWRRAIAADADQLEARRSLGVSLAEAGRKEEAREVFEAWLRRDQNSPVARHLLAACTGRDIPNRAPDEYVTEVFDRFAAGFDEQLEQLGYRLPEIVHEELDTAIGDPEGTLSVLDAGCGTGLCAAALKPWAKRLVGVDLSRGMLRRAAALNAYDELVAAELTAFLTECPEAFDVIAVVDTLNYFGDLAPVLAAHARALKPDGLLLATIESATTGEAAADYALLTHGRYSHAESYVRGELKSAGFAIENVRTDTIRMEAGEPVEGLIIRARHAPND